MRFLALLPFLMLCACRGQVGDGSLLRDTTKLAEQGNQEAQDHLGMLYNNGIGTKKDPQKAFEWVQ